MYPGRNKDKEGLLCVKWTVHVRWYRILLDCNLLSAGGGGGGAINVCPPTSPWNLHGFRNIMGNYKVQSKLLYVHFTHVLSITTVQLIGPDRSCVSE